MIHRIEITNYQSIRETVVLDFRIPATSPVKPQFRNTTVSPAFRIPTVVGFFGPNGSGKTTILRALIQTIRFAAHSYTNDNLDDYFPPFLVAESIRQPTQIVVDFDGIVNVPNQSESTELCRYTLRINRIESDGQATIDYEAIHHYPNGRKTRLMERCGSQTVFVAPRLGVKSRDERLSAVPGNSSAVSALGKMQIDWFSTLVKKLNTVQSNVFGPDPWKAETGAIVQFIRENPQLGKTISDRLRSIDLGIVNMEVVQLKYTGEWVLLFRHHGLTEPVPLCAESAGTRHFIHIFPQLNHALEAGSLAIMDSLDNDFHTELTAEILDWFRRKDTNQYNSQLFCSLSNTSLLDDFDKEELFLVEKSLDGATSSYGAKEIKGLRRTSNLQKSYRGGFLGGLPTFG